MTELNNVVNNEIPTAHRIKTFKNSELIEGFYRYIHENSLREEAHGILQHIAAMSSSYKPKRKKKGKTLQ